MPGDECRVISIFLPAYVIITPFHWFIGPIGSMTDCRAFLSLSDIHQIFTRGVGPDFSLWRAVMAQAARRRLSLSGLIVFTADADFTDSWWDFVSAKLLVQRDPTNAVLVQYRQACSYAYTVSYRQSVQGRSSVSNCG